MAFLAGTRLAQDIPSYEIVRPFREEQIDCNACTLSMGEEYYVTKESGSALWKNKKQSLKLHADFFDSINAIKGRGESFVIPPGQFAFLLTEESVRMPAHLMGFISLKSRIKFRGLINVSGFHVDPGFEGNLIYSVYNAGPSKIHIARGDPLFLLWLAEISGEIDPKYIYGPKFPQVEISNRLVSEVAAEVQSLNAVSRKLDKLEQRVNIVWAIAIALVATLTLFFTIIAALPDASMTNLIQFFRSDKAP